MERRSPDLQKPAKEIDDIGELIDRIAYRRDLMRQSEKVATFYEGYLASEERRFGELTGMAEPPSLAPGRA